MTISREIPQFPAPEKKHWYAISIEDAAHALESDAVQGIGADEAAARQVKYGRNELKAKEAHTPLQIFLEQFRDFIIWVLVAAALVSGFLREWVDALAIVVIVILNAILGFVQEYRAEKSLAALKKLSSPTTKVIRAGKAAIIPSADLVPGDLVELDAGDLVPADCRLVWVTPNFATLEASLTGESNPVLKTVEALDEPDVQLADRANMVYVGTSVASGRGRALVVHTGMGTELGKIAGMIQEIERVETPLQKKLEQFGKWIVYLAFVLVAIVFILEFIRGGRVIDIFLTAVSLAVAAIPEGLPAVVTIALALGVHRMVKRHALIRKLPSVETLGSATVICSDKTGTLTKNEMTVQAVYTAAGLFRVTGVGYAPKGDLFLGDRQVQPAEFPGLLKALECGMLCNGSRLIETDGVFKITGDPTEAALLTVAAKAGLSRETLEKEYPFVEEIPFDSERKKMTVIRKDGAGGLTAFIKGAPDILLGNCTRLAEGTTFRALTDADCQKILVANDALASQALRVLAVACRPFEQPPASYEAHVIEQDLVFLGLVAMIDPARPEVKEAIKRCTAAGIKTVMITGDHKNTAVAIARELGIFKEGSLALSGEELDTISDDELFAKVETIAVYARVSPEHKFRIVKAWRKRGEIVAMTGDGVNDAPAVREADIGVAMGIAGTDVTKEVSDMVITDDNFASIVAAVEEGRGIYDNIRKFIHYLLSCNTGEILVMFIASLVALPVPLLPIHILWINLVTDGLPALALGVDPVNGDVMDRPPRPVNEPVVTRQRGILMLLQGSFIAFCSLLAFVLVLYVEKEGIARARTAAFIVLSCSQLFHAFNCRSIKRSLFDIGFFTNRNLVFAALISFLLMLLAIYTPLSVVFKTVPLSAYDWLLAVALSSFPLWAMELVKRTMKKLVACCE
jgi:Ca2+-transporting ATPase